MYRQSDSQLIERTKDYRIVKKIASWNPIISSEIIYLLDNDINLWTFHEYLDGMMIHANMSIKCRGKLAVESAKRAFKWIFENTTTEIIYAGIPDDRKKVCYMAVRFGMEFTHKNENKRYYEVKKCHSVQ